MISNHFAIPFEPREACSFLELVVDLIEMLVLIAAKLSMREGHLHNRLRRATA